MAAEWYYRKGGEKFGPIEPAMLVRLAQSGRLRPDDFVLKQGMKSWVAASSIKGLSFGPAAPSEPPPKATSGEQPTPLPQTENAPRRRKTISTPSSFNWVNAILLGVGSVGVFGLGFLAAKGLGGGSKSRNVVNPKTEQKALEVHPDQELAKYLRQYQAAPQFEDAQALSEMPKELQGQWFEVMSSGDQGETYTRITCKKVPEFLMFANRHCHGDSKRDPLEFLNEYGRIWRLPDSEDKAAWAFEPIEGICYVVHRTKTQSKYVVRFFEGEGELATPTYRSIFVIKPHSAETMKKFESVAKSAEPAELVPQASSTAGDSGVLSPKTERSAPEKRPDADARNFVWGDSPELVMDTAEEVLSKATSTDRRELTLHGAVVIDGEPFAITYAFFGDRLVAVNLGAFSSDKERGDDWNPYATLNKIHLLFSGKYGFDLQNNFAGASNEGKRSGYLALNSWSSLRPFGQADMKMVWDLPRHTITLSAGSYIGRGSDTYRFCGCQVSYSAKSEDGEKYRQYLKEREAQEEQLRQEKRLRAADGL